MNDELRVLAVAGRPLLPMLAWASFFGLGYAYVTVLCVFGEGPGAPWMTVAAGPILLAAVTLAVNGWVLWRALRSGGETAARAVRSLTVGSAILSSVATVWIAGALLVIRSC